ncbi:MAG: hypothetical protein ACI8S6_001273 [Myxococcota bacterium]|jgi:hypothetical protein
MQTTFNVQVLDFNLLRELSPRTASDHAAMLEAMDYGDTSGMSDEELREMCVASLQDLDPSEAAELVLRHDLSDRLRKGQIKNMSHEMTDEKFWEYYPDMSLHERLFGVGSLLYQAFPRVFPEPDAVRVQLEVSATDPAGRALLAAPLPESFVVRLLADGMPGAIIHRLFEDQLAGTHFPEAESIVWTVLQHTVDDNTVHLNVTSSGSWLDPMRHTRSYTSTAHPDS